MARKPKPWFYKRDGWWMVWLNGKRVKLAEGKKNKKLAEQRLLEFQLVASSNPPPENPGQTVASVIDTYLAHASKRLAASTLALRKPYLQSFAEAHGWRLVRDCTGRHLQDWLDSHPEWVSDWTKSSSLRNVQVAFNWAAKQTIRLIRENPFRGVAHHTGPPRRNVTDDEFQALLRATGDARSWQKPTPAASFRRVLIFLRFTGCRPQEACLLEWQHVDFENSMIILPYHKTTRTQRRPTPRLIPMDSVIVKLLHWIRRQEQGDRVFVNSRGTPWNKNTLGQRLYRARKIAGIPEDAKLYGIRHAFGTRGVLKGCDLKTLSTLMGHTTTRMTEHYVHLAGEHQHLVAAMQQVNGRRQGA